MSAANVQHPSGAHLLTRVPRKTDLTCACTTEDIAGSASVARSGGPSVARSAAVRSHPAHAASARSVGEGALAMAAARVLHPSRAVHVTGKAPRSPPAYALSAPFFTFDAEAALTALSIPRAEELTARSVVSLRARRGAVKATFFAHQAAVSRGAQEA